MCTSTFEIASYPVCGDSSMVYSAPESHPSRLESNNGSVYHAALAIEPPSSDGTPEMVHPRLSTLHSSLSDDENPTSSKSDSPISQKQASTVVLNSTFNGIQLENDYLTVEPRQRLLFKIQGGGREQETSTKMAVSSNLMCSTPGKSSLPSPVVPSPGSRILRWLDECDEADTVLPSNFSDYFQSRALGVRNHRVLQEVRSPVLNGSWSPFADFHRSHLTEEEALKAAPCFSQPKRRPATSSIPLFSNEDELPDRPGSRASVASSSSYSTHPEIREIFAFFQNLSVEEVLERREREAATLQELAIYDLALPQRPVQLKNRSLSPPPPPPPPPSTSVKVKRRPSPLNIGFSPPLSLSRQRLPRFNEENPREPEVDEPMLSFAEALAATEVKSTSELFKPSNLQTPRRTLSVNFRTSSLFSQSASAVSGLRKSLSSPLHDIPRRLSAAFSVRRSSRKSGDDLGDESDCSSIVSSVVEILQPPSRWSMSTTDGIVESPMKRTWGSLRRKTMSPRE